jgi:hypothetical protein
VNKKDIASKAVALRRLPSEDMVLAIDSEQACTNWLAVTTRVTTDSR